MTRTNAQRLGSIDIEGLDFRGTLGVDKGASVGFQSIRVKSEADSPAGAEGLAQLVKLKEPYCVVLRALKGSAALSTEVSNSHDA